MLYGIRKTKFLRNTACPAGFHYPPLSVIIPAKDEANTIEAALLSKLQSDYPSLEVIAIDDRSSDQTFAAISRVAENDPRVKPLRITTLPPGWLGKVNALDKGVKSASGQWLLFSDADVHFSPDALKKAVCFAQTNGLDHLAVMPQLWSNGFFMDMVFAPFLDTALRWSCWNSQDSRGDAAVGVGAFNLVRRAAFEKTPGFEWLRLEVIDDMGLGLMMRKSGFKGAALNGEGCVGLHFLENFGEAVKSCDKGVFAGAGFNPLVIFAAAFAGVFFDLLPFALLFAGGTAAKIAAAACGTAVLKSALIARWNKLPVFPALFVPIGGVIGVYLLLHGAASALASGGITWRGTFYPTKDLKAAKRFLLKNFY